MASATLAPAASISADKFFSQSSAFTQVIQSCASERKNKLSSLDGVNEKKSEANGGTGEGDESSSAGGQLGNLIEQLQAKQQVLKSLAQFNQQHNEKELAKNRQELVSALPTDPCVLMGMAAVKEELKQCAAKIGGVSFSCVPHISVAGAQIFRLGVIDLMSVEIVIDQSGAIKQAHVTANAAFSSAASTPNNATTTSHSSVNAGVVSAATQLFTQFLQQAKFNEFVKYFRGWLSTYLPVVDSVKIRPKLICAISAIEADIGTINRSFLNSIHDHNLKNMIKTVIHGTPCGLFQNFPKVCKPTLKYFVSPYDVMKEGKTMESDIEDIPKDAGMVAEIEFYPVNSPNILAPCDVSNPSPSATTMPTTPLTPAMTPGSGPAQGKQQSVRKMQICPMVLSEVPLKIGQSLNATNSAPLPVSFCLQFPNPIPFFAYHVNELHDYTKSLVCESKEPKQWLFALSVFEGVIPDPDHQYYHSLPSCDISLSILTKDCCQQVTSSNHCYVVQGVMFSHVNALPHIIHIVRKQVAMNSLVGELMRKQTVSNAKQVNMSIPDPGRISLKFIHPLKSTCIVTVDVEVTKPDFANPSCHISTSDSTFVCEDAYPTTILRKCGSLAHLVRSVMRKCSTLRVDIATPSGSGVPSLAPPLTPTIDVKMAISFDRSTMESNDIPTTETILPSAQTPMFGVRANAASLQNLKLVDMLQSDLPATALTSLTSAVSESLSYEDSLTSSHASMQVPAGVSSLAAAMSAQQSSSGGRKRARVKSTQDDGGSPAPGKAGGKQSKATKRSMSVAGPMNLPNSPGGGSNSTGGTNSPALQLQQQIQVLSMMGNSLLPLHMQPTPPPPILTPQPVTPDSSSTFDMNPASNSMSSPATSNANIGDSKLREILNSSKLASGSSPVSSSQIVAPPSSLQQLGAVNFEQLPPISVGGQHNPPTPLLSPSMQEFVYSQQAAALAKISSFALARQFKPSIYDMGAPTGLDPSAAAAHLNYQATANAHIQQLLQPALAGVNAANAVNSSQSLSSSDRSTNSLLGSSNINPGISSAASMLHNLTTSSIMSSIASDMTSPASSTFSKQPSLPSLSSLSSENDRALKYLGDLWKQLDNKKNLSNSEIEAIERKMNQIQNNLALKDSMNQANSASSSSYKRKNSVDFTDSSSVSSNQSLGESKNSSDFGGSSSVVAVSTTPTKRPKNPSGPPKRRGRPPKSMMGEPKGHSEGSPYSQLVPKFGRSESVSGGPMELTGGSPVKMLKLTPYSIGGSSVGSGKLYTIRSGGNDLDAFEMSDDSSDSGATLMSQQSTPHPVPPPSTLVGMGFSSASIGSTAMGTKKTRVVKKPRVSKKSAASAASSTADSESNTTTYKSLNKSDTVIVIKKVGGPNYSQSSGIANSSSSVSTAMGKEATSVTLSTAVSSMSSPGAQTPNQAISSQASVSSSKDFSITSLKSESSTFSFKETSSGYMGSSKSSNDSVPAALASSKMNPGLENKSSPMKNLFASFAAETSGSSSASGLAKTSSSSSDKDKDKDWTASSKTAGSEFSSISSKSSVAEVTSSLQTSSSSTTSSTTSSIKSSPSGNLLSLTPSKKRVGLESVVSKLNTSPVASNSGSSGYGSSTSSGLGSSTSGSKTIVASTLLKSSSLKLQKGDSSLSSGIKSSSGKSKSFSEKSKHLSGDKSSSQKSSGNSASKTPGSPISAANFPSFLKSSNKLGNFVIPKKKSGGGGGSSGSGDSHKHLDQSDSSRNSNGSSPSSASDSSISKAATGANTQSSTSTSSISSLTTSSASTEQSKNKMGDKMFDFPLTEDHVLPTSSKLTSTKSSSSSSVSSSSVTSSGVSSTASVTSQSQIVTTSSSSSSTTTATSGQGASTLSASSGTIFSGEQKSAVTIPLNRIQHPLTSYSIGSASDSSPASSESPPTIATTEQAPLSDKTSTSSANGGTEGVVSTDSQNDSNKQEERT